MSGLIKLLHKVSVRKFSRGQEEGFWVDPFVCGYLVCILQNSPKAMSCRHQFVLSVANNSHLISKSALILCLHSFECWFVCFPFVRRRRLIANGELFGSNWKNEWGQQTWQNSHQRLPRGTPDVVDIRRSKKASRRSCPWNKDSGLCERLVCSPRRGIVFMTSIRDKSLAQEDPDEIQRKRSKFRLDTNQVSKESSRW